MNDDELPDESDSEPDNFGNVASKETQQNDMNILEELEVYEVVPVEQAEGTPWVTARWVIDHRIGGEVRPRVVAREFKKERLVDEFVAPSAGQSPTKLVDYSALLRRHGTFTVDVPNAFFRVDETEEVNVHNTATIMCAGT